jgi:hypothetical protein
MEIYGEALDGLDESSAQEMFRGSLGSSTWQAPSGVHGPTRIEWDGAGFAAKHVGFFISCSDPTGCHQAPGGDIRIRGRSFEFTLEDLVAPHIDTLSGSLVDSGWLSGTQSLEIGAVDVGGGIARAITSLGARPLLNASSECQKIEGRFVDLQPCPLADDWSWEVDTNQLDDGPARLDVQVQDIGGQSATESTLVFIDNTAPSAPSSVTVDGHEGWRSENQFRIRWHGQALHAPIAQALVEICRWPSGPCEDTARYGGDSALVAVPAPGAFVVRIRLEDAAGNVGPASSSAEPILRFDNRRPGRARVDVPARWLGGKDLEAVEVVIGLENLAAEPASGIAGYSVSTGDVDPDPDIDLWGRSTRFGLESLPEGETPLRVRAVSGSAIASEEIGTGIVRIDRSAPLVELTGLRNDSGWLNRAVEAQILGSDQVDLSGMMPASSGQPLEDGAHIAIRLNDRATQKTRGAEAHVLVAEDGEHTLTYQAFDAAGNGSVEKEARFRIDATAPVGEFRALDPRDPTAMRVDVGDATSGVADGWIEYLRVGDGDFRRLETALRDGVLTARLDDASLAAGRYLLRAVIHDVAGNRAIVDRWADGSSAVLGLPLRLGAKLEATGERSGRCRVARKPKAGRRRVEPVARTRCRTRKRQTRTLALGFGKRGRTAGRLTTDQGAPIAGAAVVVEGRPRSGGSFKQLGTARTDRAGRFAFRVPRGPSRTVRYRYAGTSTTRPATAELTTRVRAAARLKVDRRRLRNGQAVRFSGRLLGRPIPPAGKLVTLQAKVGGGWRTFATPRAGAGGRFTHRYRFTATTGTRRYAFRVLVAREGAYPYEAGTSRTVKVTVRGREAR